MLLSTSFAFCLSDKMHQCGLSKAEYARLWYPVQFPIDRRCFVPESWHTLFWWLFGSFLVFSMPRSACSNTRSVDRVTSASFLFLGVMLIQIANPNIDLLYLHMLHVPICPVCLHSNRKANHPVQIYPSALVACLSLYPSICVFHIFVYDVGTLPKTACVCMHMHMAAAIVEVPVCTASYLQLCCSKVPSQEKRRGN